jgi:siroheme synthase-like protein
VTAGVPVLLHLDDRPVVAVGAGRVAAAKALPLLDAGARLTVVAPEAAPQIRAAARAGRLLWHPRPYRPGDLAGAMLALAATATADVNARVAADADAAGVWCVRVDAGGSAELLAALRRGGLSIAVSTAGNAPALAARIRAELETRYGPEYGELVALLGELRRSPDVQAQLARLGPGARRWAWRSILDTDILQLLRTGQVEAAREVAVSCLFSRSG